MMQNKYNSLLANIYGYDINSSFLKSQPYEGGLRLWNESMKTTEALISYRANYGEDKFVDKSIKTLVEMYKYLEGDNDYQEKKLKKLRAEFEGISKKMTSKGITTPAEREMGVMAPLLTHVKAAAEHAGKLPNAKAFPHKQKSIELINKLTAKLGEEIADVTSKVAEEKAGAVIESITAWSDLVANSYESGKCDEKAVLKHLEKAIKAVEEWSRSEGVSKKNPASKTSVEPFNKAIVRLYFLVQEPYVDPEAKGKEANAALDKNDLLINDIKGYVQELLKRDSQNSSLATMLKAFSNRDSLIKKPVGVSGKEYHEQLKKNEDDFMNFATFVSAQLKQICETVRKPEVAVNVDIKTSISNLKEIVSGWTENRTGSREIPKEGVIPMHLKSQILGIINTTNRDLDKYRRYCDALNYNVEDVSYTNSIRATNTLNRIAQSLEGALISDTEENYAQVENIVKQVTEIRNNITAVGTEFIMPEMLDDFAHKVDQLVKSSQKGKKLTRDHEKEQFWGEATEADFKEGRADEIESAVYVLTSLKKTEDLIAQMTASSAEDRIPIPPLYDKNSDIQYVEFKNQIDELQKMCEEELLAGNDLASLEYLEQKEAAESQASEYVEMMVNDNKLERQLALEERTNHSAVYNSILMDIRRIKTLFVGKKTVSYSVRAQVICENNFADPTKLFQQYVNAISSGNKKVAIGVLGTLKANINKILESKQIGLDVQELAKGVTMKDPAIAKKEAAQKKELSPEQAEKLKKLQEMKAKLEAEKAAKEGKTTETPVKEGGEVTKLNPEQTEKTGQFADILGQLR